MGKIADNYLSLKAYAVTANDKLSDYTAKGKGKNLSSLGDLLISVASLSDVKPQKAEGLSASSSLPGIFTSDKVKVDNKVTKINGMVNEFVGLSNKLNDFEDLAVSMGSYEKTLAKLTAELSGRTKKVLTKRAMASPPEWDGK